MFPQVFIVFLSIYAGIIQAAPPPVNKNPGKSQKEIPVSDSNVLNPHIITIDRLEALLQRASEIFKPVLPVRQNDAKASSVPMEYLQPPSQPYNFYLPLFDLNDSASTIYEDKIEKMEKFIPPPKPKGIQHSTTNFQDFKPKKSPKKFNSDTKHINIKWLNNYEKQLSSPSNKKAVNIPKDVYLMNDERNRINFDDSFFAVDMKVPERPNKLDRPTQGAPDSSGQQNEDYFNQGEEDLIAAAAIQIPIFRDLIPLRRN